MSDGIILKEERYALVGAALEVHRTIGNGFTEYVYQDALEVEFQKRNIPYVREKHMNVFYKNIKLRHDFYVDFLCYGRIIIECKATSSICGEHEAQIINYCNIGKSPVGILINFGTLSLQYKQFVFSKYLNMHNDDKKF